MRIATSVLVITTLFLLSHEEGYGTVVADHTTEVRYYGAVEDFVSDFVPGVNTDTDNIVTLKKIQNEGGQEEEEEEEGTVLRLLKKKKSNKKNSKTEKKPTRKPTRKPASSPTTDPPTATPPLSDGELTFPEEMHAEDGRFVVTMDYADYKTVAVEQFTTRLFGGIMPGKTVIVNPGEVLEITFKNNLVLQPNSVQGPEKNNTFGIPDTTNLHFHGGHISGEEPSDDIYIHVRPGGGTYEYTSAFPSDHMPGYEQLYNISSHLISRPQQHILTNSSFPPHLPFLI